MTQTVLITGCSSGFGKAAASLFLDRGWNVVATMLEPDPDLFGERGDKLSVTRLDVTDQASISAAIDAAIDRFGQLDVVVNNAGIGLFSAFEGTSTETIHKLFETNIIGPMAVTKAVIPHMRERGTGTIVNVSSSIGFAPIPMMSVYAATKHGIEGFVEAASWELSAVGIRMKLVEPGFAQETDFTNDMLGRLSDGMIPEPYQAYSTRIQDQMRNNPSELTSQAEVTEAIFAAATDTSTRLRYVAGADAKMFAELRWSTSEKNYEAKMQEMFRPA